MTDPTDRRIAYKGRIDSPCSACGDGDTAMEYHDHERRRGERRKRQLRNWIGTTDDERRPDSDRRRACHGELGDSCDVCTPELAAPGSPDTAPTAPVGHKVQDETVSQGGVPGRHGSAFADAESRSVEYSRPEQSDIDDPESWRQVSEDTELVAPTPVQTAEGRMPSCHACGTIMEGVCPKCGTTTCVAAASVPVQPVTEQEAREWLKAHVRDQIIRVPAAGQTALQWETVASMLAAFANRTAPAGEGK